MCEKVNSDAITLDRADYSRVCSALRLTILDHYNEPNFNFHDMFNLYDAVKREEVKYYAIRGVNND